jgi:hypothetical protein
MYFDNITIVGLAVAFLTALLPLLFGKEALRVREDDTPTPEGAARERVSSPRRVADIDCSVNPEPCR